jgi:hypothetical protein
MTDPHPFFTYSANKLIELLGADEARWRHLLRRDMAELRAALKGTRFEEMREIELECIAWTAWFKVTVPIYRNNVSR